MFVPPSHSEPAARAALGSYPATLVGLTASGLAQEKEKRSQSGYWFSAAILSPQHADEHPKDSLSNQSEITFYVRFDNRLPKHSYTIYKDFATFY